jgi:coenzyme F420 biosynthesis associated uncharacterized protein
MIDWSLAERLGGIVAQEPPGGAALAGDLAAFSADAVERVTAYTGMTPAREIPPPEAISRREWVRANLGSMRTIMSPIEEKMSSSATGPLRGVTGALTGAEIGVLVGYLGQRVLGQYELVLIDAASPERLLFVAPNLRAAARRLEVNEESLVAWVAFHEVTHAVQFTSVPWLREHLAGMLGELLGSVDDVKVDTKSLLSLDLSNLRALVERVKEDGLVTLAAGPERMAIIDRMQATMALVEGHAEHVMDAVGAEALDDLDELRAALDRRRSDKPLPLKVVERLLGLELKMRQYVLGKAFVDHVVAERGIAGLNRVWESPDLLPSLHEIELPEAWLARVPAA